MLSHRLSPLVVLAAVVAVAVAPLSATASPTPAEPDAKGVASSSAGGSDSGEVRARAALDQVRAFAGGSRGGAELRTPSGAADAPADLTMALRDLANLRVHLTGEDRDAAEALLKRPDDPGGDEVGLLNYGSVTPVRNCTADVCVHHTTTGRHSATAAFAAEARSALTRIHDVYVGAGYREPKPDGSFGGDARIDVYLGDIGEQGIYGYCTSDQPEPDPTPSTFDRWAYCVLDEDYAEFPTNTPLENLRVTAAHEYFHATQFAYDRYEDSWLLEATAAWIEDEMYDGVDDNVQYLASSQLSRPGTPLDTFNQNTLFHYGTWSYFRFLTERFRARQGQLPKLVLDVWRRADGSAGARDQYSWQAVNSALRTRRTTAPRMLASYAVANRRPARAYDEGRANRYRAAPLGFTRKLSPAKRAATATVVLDHLATSTGRFKPQRLKGPGWKLRVRLDMAPTRRGSIALVTTVTRSGKAISQRVRLNRQGNGKRVVAFRTGRVRAVELTLVNGSGRFACFTRGAFSCQGTPKDDNLRQRVRVTAFR